METDSVEMTDWMVETVARVTEYQLQLGPMEWLEKKKGAAAGEGRRAGLVPNKSRALCSQSLTFSARIFLIPLPPYFSSSRPFVHPSPASHLFLLHSIIFPFIDFTLAR